jgi:hypothetical protein
MMPFSTAAVEKMADEPDAVQTSAPVSAFTA